ncbi:hypothetical protein BGX31_010630 [Mortierella sp. GBA43]|nr:hypothetical protein BGX31_010630 [Mortierella sp. GBA43]
MSLRLVSSAKNLREQFKSNGITSTLAAANSGLTTKGILRPVQMGHNQKMVMDTIRLILDDDTNTELSPLHQLNIHIIADAMKWAIRYSQETLVSYEDFQTYYVNQDRSFSRFINSLPFTNRQILLDLFSLCADVTLLAHLNNMTLVTVAKAISLCIMAEPEREFTTFDASLQQRNLWGAACEDLLRAFLRIKTTHDLAKIVQEDDIDENRYVDNVTRKLKSARQMNRSPMNSAPLTPTGLSRSGTGYFDEMPTTPRSASPFSELSRSASNAQSRPTSPQPFDQDRQEYEDMMQGGAYLREPARSKRDRRRSSVTDMDSLYMLPVDSTTDGYESEPEPARSSLMPDFVDSLGWDLSKLDDLHDDRSANVDGGREQTLRQLVSAPIFITQDTDSDSIQRSATVNNARVGHAISPSHTSAAMSPQRAKRNSILRRSMSLDPHTMHGRVHRKPNELRHDIMSREAALQAERSQVAEDIRSRLLMVKESGALDSSSSSPRSTFSLESSQDGDRPAIPARGASQGLGRSLSKTSTKDAKLEINVGNLPSHHSIPEEPSSITSPPPSHQPSSRTERKSETTTRKEGEVSVIFTPLSPNTPASPRTELKSKFQESFTEKPVTPPLGYSHSQSSGHKRSPSAKSQGSKMSPSTSTVPSPMQSKSVSRSNSRGQLSVQPPPLQHSASFSGLPSSAESKSKAAGFIRALSFKLRSKHSDEHLKAAAKMNTPAADIPPVPKTPVSIQPPRLELSFLGESSASAPASLRQSASTGSGGGAGSDKYKARRQSGVVFASGNVASIREQRRRSRVPTTSRYSSSLHHAQAASSLSGNSKGDGKRNGASSITSSVRGSKLERTPSDSSYTSDDNDNDNATLCDSTLGENGKGDKATGPKKAGAGEREYRFSTATLLKDGKLYYQLQWEDFSEAGFAGDFFHQPEQYLTGLYQKRMSKMVVSNGDSGNGPVMNSSNSVMAGSQTNLTTTTEQDQAATVGRSPSSQGPVVVGQDPGPSPAQRAAAMKAARESFMALAKDPKALAALKAGSTGGIGQATIIGTGSFPIGSAQPVLHSQPLNLNWDPVPSSSRNGWTLQPTDEHEDEDEDERLHRNTSGKSSSTLSTTGTASLDSRKETERSGNPSTIVGGVGSSSSSPLARGPLTTEGNKDPRAPVSNPAMMMPPVKPAKKNRLFGVKLKGSKKTNRLSTSAGTLSAAMANGNLSSTNLGSKKKQQQSQKLPAGLMRKDLMTKTEEAVDEYFPWTCIEHMGGQDSGWVMLEPVQDGAVGWVKIDKLEEEIARVAAMEQQQQQQMLEQQQMLLQKLKAQGQREEAEEKQQQQQQQQQHQEPQEQAPKQVMMEMVFEEVEMLEEQDQPHEVSSQVQMMEREP